MPLGRLKFGEGGGYLEMNGGLDLNGFYREIVLSLVKTMDVGILMAMVGKPALKEIFFRK